MIIAVLASIVIASAANQLLFPQRATVNQVTDIQAYVDAVFWQNNTTIDWGQLDRDTTYSKYFEVKNNGNVNITNGHLLLIITGLPTGWVETYSLNDSYVNLQPQVSVSGTLDLYVPFDAIPSVTYNWASYVSIT